MSGLRKRLVQGARSASPPPPASSHPDLLPSSTTTRMSPETFDAHRNPTVMSSMSSTRVHPTTGVTKEETMAGKYLLDIASAKGLHPIYDPPFTLDNDRRLNKIGIKLAGPVDTYKDKNEQWGPVLYTPTPDVRIKVRDHITQYIGQGTATPLVFLLTSNIPHAAIVIRTSDGRLYSCGFGYFGDVEPGEAPVEARIQRMVEKIDDKLGLEKRLGLKLPHKVEALRGAIYSPDIMDPGKPARVIWIGRLTRSIVRRLNDFLITTQEIYFGGKYADIDKGHIQISKTTLTLPDVYMESASIWKRGKSIWSPIEIYWNCLEWAKSILGIQLDCGPLEHPSSCKAVTEQEVTSIILARTDAEQERLIKAVSDRIEFKGVCAPFQKVASAVTRCFGDWCSKKGGRRRRNYKNTRRRIQIRSGTRRSRK